MKDINTIQLIEYAKNNGYNSIKFYCKTKKFTGKFLDAYFEFVELPLLGKGFATISQIEEVFGYDLKFDVITDDEYKTLTALSFVIRGKDVPKEYNLKVEE